MAWQSGELIGAYRIEKQLGSGGMATVYKAYHEKLDRHVAIKVMHQALLEDANFHERFRREARIVAKLEHPNIVSVFDFNDHEKQPYLVMKYVDGRTLKHVLKDSPMPLNEIQRVMKTIANALDYAHRHGVLHRDIKPSNIIIDTNGTPYLTDFGLARIAQSGESTMSADMMLGTPYYISPEQAQGSSDIDTRSDVYSFGIILYELLVGRVPFAADTPYAIVHNHIFGSPPAPRELNPAISEEVERVLLKALAKEPDYRYQSAGELMQALESALDASQMQHIDDNRRQADYSIMEYSPVVPPRLPEAPEVPEKPLENVEDLGENIGKWGENFGKDMESFGERIEEAFRTKSLEFGRDEDGKVKIAVTDKNKRDAMLTPEERVRRRIKKRQEERNGVITHTISYVFINLMLFALWGWDGVPIPQAFIALPWGIGLVSHWIKYWNEYGPGYERQERMIQAEIERELARERYDNGPFEKSKNDEFYEEDEPSHGRLRLNEDGEFTDSFIEELDEEKRRKNR